MKNFVLTSYLLLTFCCTIKASPETDRTDSLLSVLKVELGKKKYYDQQKEARIRRLKDVFRGVAANDLSRQYSTCKALAEEYHDYQFDSAFVYTRKLIELSKKLRDPIKLNENKIRLGITLIASGMFKETFDCLHEIEPAYLDKRLKRAYYELHSWAYSDLAKYNKDKFYAPAERRKKFLYLDSAIALTAPNSFGRLILQAQLPDTPGVKIRPRQYYLTLLKRKLSPHEEAMVSTGLSRYCSGKEKVRLLTIAAINDIRTSTNETQAILALGKELYNQRSVQDAYLFIQQAMNQANLFGAKLHKYQVAEILPIVAAEKILQAEREKQRFVLYLAAILVLMVIGSLIFFIIFVQFKKLRVQDLLIREKNAELERTNGKLAEDGRIKEEYIGYFFDELSGYILRLEKLKRTVERKVLTGRYDDVLKAVGIIHIKSERKKLFETFDQVFLQMFPDFVSAFNSLLRKEDQIWPKPNEGLTANLRIFALMRLGVTSNEKIAGILEYTVSTVYTYRFRTRSKALVQSDEFESRIMGIRLTGVNKS
jgi:hypothetical protein